jgi:hypothetical protein
MSMATTCITARAISAAAGQRGGVGSMSDEIKKRVETLIHELTGA